MLTNAQMERLAKLIQLAPQMDKEMQGKLVELIRDLKAAERASVMPGSAIQQMAECVDDKQMRDIVNDLRTFGRAEPGGFLGPTKTEKREPRRAAEVPLEPPSGIRYVDQIADHFDKLDRLQTAKQIADAIKGAR